MTDTGLVTDVDAAQALSDERAALGAAIVADVRVWLTRLCAGERVSSRAMSPKLDRARASRAMVRLRDLGLVTTSHGNHGGAEATPLLLEHARKDVSDAWIADILWPPLGAKSTATTAHERPDSPPRGPRLQWAPPPRTQAAREAMLVKHLRTWLTQAAAGEPVRAGRISNCAGAGFLSQLAGRLRDAGLLEVHGPTGNRWFGGTEALGAQWPLSDEQLAVFVWPHKVTGAPPPPAKDWDDEEPTHDSVPGTTEASAPHAPQDPLDLLATRMLDFLRVLEHLNAGVQQLNARVRRLEKVWDLPPLEGDPS